MRNENSATASVATTSVNTKKLALAAVFAAIAVAGSTTFVVPFLVSTCGGTLIAVIITVALSQTGFLERAKEMLK